MSLIYNFSSIIIKWYSENKRDLPWRNTQNPYFIWLSEIILQQTRVAQGLNYYIKFTEKYPTVEHLSMAKEDEVLRLWQGLGYYSRARNLYKTSKIIVEYYNGKFPNTFHELLKLKGVGEYTAAAIASFSFNERVAVLDGNVIRVLCRYFGIENDISLNTTKNELKELANSLLPKLKTDIYNQAIMEFGALQCVPSNPKCEKCPLSDTCLSFKSKKVSKIPFKSKKQKKKNRYFFYLILTDDKNSIALQKRSKNDIWNGLYEFPLIESSNPYYLKEDIIKLIQQYLNSDKFSIEEIYSADKHVLSHQNIYSYFVKIKLKMEIKLDECVLFYNIEQIRGLPKSVLINNYLTENIF